MSTYFTLINHLEGFSELVFNYPNEKVNKLNENVLDELSSFIDQIAESDTKALIIRSGKPNTFIAGADLKRFQEAFSDVSLAIGLIGKGHAVFDKLDALSIPTVAAIDGICLGGGTELALACDYRILSDNPKLQIGLPEVNLGIFPGWGGTQRLPRLIGLSKGLQMIVSGKAIDAKKAYKYGIASALYAQEFFEEKSMQFMRELLAGKTPKRTLKRSWTEALLETNPIGQALLFSFTKKEVEKKTEGHYPAPLLALEVIKKTHALSLHEGLEKEKELFIEGLRGKFKNSKQLINLFFATEEVKKDPGFSFTKKHTPHEIKEAGVIGAGVMGGPIAWLFTYCNIPVRVKEVQYKLAVQAFSSALSIYGVLKKKRKITSDGIKRKIHLLSITTDNTGFKQADIVVEAATENLEVKKKIFQEMEQAVSEKTILATNTSSIVMSKMTPTLKYPERFIGMHFFNPPNRMPLVEIIPSPKTSEEVIARVCALCKEMKKTPIVVKDCAGFLVNRIFAAAANEACFLLQEGIPMTVIDKAMKEFGMPMGPFVLADEVGNDVAYKVFNILEEAYGSRMALPEIVKLVYENGLYGKKIGKGYYLHTKNKRVQNPEIDKLLKGINYPHAHINPEEISERIVFAMINESARCLEESVVKSPIHLDVALTYGMGFPPFRGGLLAFADEVGIEEINKKLESFAVCYGERLLPCNKLLEMEKQGTHFYAQKK